MVSAHVWPPKTVVLFLAAAVPKAVRDSLFSFSRQYRLVSRQDFRSVFDNSSKITQPLLLALCRPNELSHIRLGLVISKQLIKRAVDRNKLRRLIRETIRQHPVRQVGIDLVIMGRKNSRILDALKVNKSEILLDVKNICDKVVNKW